MALANISILLTQWGYKTLIVDWDLEAPGLEYFFTDYVSSVRYIKNLVLLICSKILVKNDCKDTTNSIWKDMLIEIPINKSNTTIDFHFCRSKKDNNYYQKVREIDFKDFYSENGGYILEKIREEWKTNYDFILIDSRTGITDIGGICTIHLPDILDFAIYSHKAKH